MFVVTMWLLLRYCIESVAVISGMITIKLSGFSTQYNDKIHYGISFGSWSPVRGLHMLYIKEM